MIQTKLTKADAGAMLAKIKQQPLHAMPEDQEKMAALLAEKALYIAIRVGEQFTHKHGWFAVVKMDYPHLLIEFTAVVKGFESQDAQIKLGEVICYKSSYLKVVHILGKYFVCEFVGITEKLERTIAFGKARKQISETRQRLTGASTDTAVRKRKKPRWRKR